jgi:hypothetical protein
MVAQDPDTPRIVTKGEGERAIALADVSRYQVRPEARRVEDRHVRILVSA